MRGRKQNVKVDGSHSSTRDITLGVPQGSILGPVSFLVFINDLPSALQRSVADLYADDTTISYSTDYKVASQAINNGLQTDLDINETKTKAMLDTGKWIKKRMNNKQLQVELNASELIQVSSQNS